MDYRRFFLRRDPYDIEASEGDFFRAVKTNVERQIKGSAKYREMLEALFFSLSSLKIPEDLTAIPPIPTLYFKRNRIFSMEEKRLVLKATSSGTTGRSSMVGFDRKTIYIGIRMMLRFLRHHRLLSLKKHNYILMGYEPREDDERGAIKTAYYMTYAARRGRIEYYLKASGSGYADNTEGIIRALKEYEREGRPVRFLGFPGFLYELLRELEKRDICLSLRRGSKVLIGGGFKTFSRNIPDRERFNEMIGKHLGIQEDEIIEFFSAVEHPVPYIKCRCGHFHMPVYSRVYARDMRTLEVLPDGREGLLDFITPLVDSMPLVSVLTDDIGTVCYDMRCGCGNTAPYFDLSGRAGVGDIVTCSNEAINDLKNG